MTSSDSGDDKQLEAPAATGLTRTLGLGFAGGAVAALALAVLWSLFGGAAQTTDIGTLEGRLASIENSLKALPKNPVGRESLDRVTANLEKAEAVSTALSARLDSLKGEFERYSATQAAKLKSDLERLGSGQDQLRTELVRQTKTQSEHAARLDEILLQLGRLQRQLADLAAREEAAKETLRRGTLSIALANLKAAIARGAPYEAELAALAKQAPPNTDLSLMKRHAGEGVETLRALSSRFRGISQEALAAEAQSQVDPDSIVDQFLANARALVKVRRTVPGEGETTANRLARMHQSLVAGNLEAAVEEGVKISGPAAAPLATWLETARVRLAVEARIAALQSTFVPPETDRSAAKPD